MISIFDRNSSLDRSIDERLSGFLSVAFPSHDIRADRACPVQCGAVVGRPIFNQRPGRCLSGVDDDPLIRSFKSDGYRLRPVYMHSFQLSALSDLPGLRSQICRFIQRGEVSA